MKTITPLDLRKKLGAILDEASAGERFLVERDHRPVAMLVSVEDGKRLEEDPEERKRRRLAALDRLMALGEEHVRMYPSELRGVDAIRLERRRDDPE